MTNARQFLPGIMPSTALAGNGPIAGYTPNYKLNLTNFDWITWHDYEWENWSLVDALLQTAIGFLNIVGIWKPNTPYIAGQTVYDPADLSKLYRALQDHTSSSDPAQLLDPLLWLFIDQVRPPITSVFGRVGDIDAMIGDYAAFYAEVVHTHVESDITDLDKYTKAQVDASQAAQDTAIGTKLTQAQVDARVVAVGDARFMRYMGVWVAGTYTQHQVVTHNNSTWVVKAATTVQTPSPSATEWAPLGGIGGATVSATPPVSPAAGQLWYCTVNPVGLYVYVADGDSSQWVSTSGSGGGISQDAADARYLKLIGGTLTGGLTIAPPGAEWAALFLKRNSDTVANTIRFQDATGNMRWDIAHGPNADANLIISRFDAAGVKLSKQLEFRFNGANVLWGMSFVQSPAAATGTQFGLVKPADGAATASSLTFQDGNTGNARWAWVHGAGADGDFSLQQLNAAGTFQFSPLVFTTSGYLLVNWLLAARSPTANPTIMSLTKFNASQGNQIQFHDAGSIQRWTLTHQPDNEFFLARFNAAGAYLDIPIRVSPATGVTTFSAAIVNGPSDATLKDNIAPLTGALDKVNALFGRSFNMLASPDKREIGLIAQEVEPIVPELIQQFDHHIDANETVPKLAVDYSRLTALLVEAVKELSAKVAQLEAKVV